LPELTASLALSSYSCKNFGMQELMEKFIEKGLTPEQAKNAIIAIRQWLNENYPVAGTLVSSWFKDETKSLS